MTPLINKEMPSGEMTNSIMNDIEKKSCGNECNDTGIIWKLNCPKCGKIRIFKSLKGYKDAIKYTSGCSKCKASSRFIDIIGKRFNRLVVIKRMDNDSSGHLKWLCKCDCGNYRTICGENLKKTYTQSCGCYHTERIKKRPFEWVFKVLKRSAKGVGRKCHLTYEEFLDFTKINYCHYCNKIIDWRTHQTDGCRSAYYLDRKDSNIDYIRTNCVVCCTECNRVKSNRFTYEEMLKLGIVIQDILKERNIKSCISS